MTINFYPKTKMTKICAKQHRSILFFCIAIFSHNIYSMQPRGGDNSWQFFRPLVLVGGAVVACFTYVSLKKIFTPVQALPPLPEFLPLTLDNFQDQVSLRDVEYVKGAVAHGFDVNAADERGTTALHLAASRGRLAVVELLLAAKANPNAKSAASCCTPLQRACAGGHTVVARTLVNAKADVNFCNKFGMGALAIALYCKRSDTVCYLVDETDIDLQPVFDNSQSEVLAPRLAQYVQAAKTTEEKKKNNLSSSPAGH